MSNFHKGYGLSAIVSNKYGDHAVHFLDENNLYQPDFEKAKIMSLEAAQGMSFESEKIVELEYYDDMGKIMIYAWSEWVE